MKKRIGEITILNALFAMLVIFIHISSNPVSTLETNSISYIIIMTLWRFSGFVVPGFIFLSSLKIFINFKEPFNYKKFYISKLKNIILPYILWVVIFYYYFYKRGYYEHSLKLLLESIFLGNLVAHFYFVIAIVQFYLLIPLWIYISKKSNSIIAIISSLLITIICVYFMQNFIMIFNKEYYFPYNDRIFTTYLIYWILGIFAGKNYEKFKQILCKNFLLLSILFIAFFASDVYLFYISKTVANVKIIELIRIFYYIFAILFFYCLSIKNEKMCQNKIVINIDKASYYIYLCHCLFIFEIDRIMAKYSITRIRYTYLLRFIFVYLITLVLCVLYVNIKKKLTLKK